jgi:hypothetical protein
MPSQADRILATRELELAQQDLREAMAEAGATIRRVEEHLNLKTAIERHPLVATCAAMAFGFIVGGGDRDLPSLLVLGAMISYAVPVNRGNGES